MEKTAELLVKLGGSEVDIPLRPGRGEDASLLTRAIGSEAAAKLAEEFKDAFYVPRRLPLANVFLCRHFKAAGKTVAEIARMVRRSDVSVRGALGDADYTGDLQ